jgi:hypothetical protein
MMGDCNRIGINQEIFPYAARLTSALGKREITDEKNKGSNASKTQLIAIGHQVRNKSLRTNCFSSCGIAVIFFVPLRKKYVNRIWERKISQMGF